MPLSNRPELTADERISLRHLYRFLGRYDKYMVAPRSLDVDFRDFAIKRFDDRFFGSIKAHVRLLTSPEFYESFHDYTYILIHHLDAIAFSDQLEEWCATGLDLIGAANHGRSDHLSVVGNGGFCLRKVESFLKVLRSDRYAVDPERYWAQLYAGRPWYVRLPNLPRKYLKRLHRFNNVRRAIDMMIRETDPPLEDVFFMQEGPKYCPGFRVATVEQALRFAFDETPRKAFELNHRRLPFGAHAWFKHDRAFWEPFLLPE